MSSYTRKTRCVVARCPYCNWLGVFFGTDRAQLNLRVVAETILHAVTHQASARKRGKVKP